MPERKSAGGRAIVSRHFIVDGYNLARSGTVFLSEDPAGPEGRGELCALLAGYVRGRGFRLTVVFDGRGSGAPQRTRQAFKGGTSVFSSRFETADDVIRDLSRSAAAGTIVVTSDRGLRGTLSARDVTVVSCEEFADRLAAVPLEGGKGAADEEEGGGKRKEKKGEGQKKKKRDREKDSTLRKL
jgi:predicted RNA-binding protein with PIN domain